MRCKFCSLEKPVEGFYKSSPTKCKDCVKAAVSQHRQANLEHVRAYDRMRGSQAHRVAARKEYQQTPAGKQALRRARSKYKVTHAKRRAAQVSVGNAVRDGRLIPWPVCAVPECSDKPQAHHPDYDRPLDVVWLCQPHHKQVHALVPAEQFEDVPA